MKRHAVPELTYLLFWHHDVVDFVQTFRSLFTQTRREEIWIQIAGLLAQN